MAFGFFKKSATADLILYNGEVLTLDPNMPEASAVACADGKIIAVGDFKSMEGLAASHTETLDLAGAYVLPGLIDTFTSPVMETLDGKFIDLRGCETKDGLTVRISDFLEATPDAAMVFGYGYSEKLLGDDEREGIKEIMTLLDELCGETPAVLLCASTVTCLLNTTASNIVRETAEEEMVQYITVPYILNLFVPFDFEEAEQAVKENIKKRLSLGFTSVLNLGSPDYFESVYQDALVSLYNEDELYLRFFGSYLMNRPLLPNGLIHRLMQRKTMCNEIGDLINARALNLMLEKQSCPMEFSQESLNEILQEVSDRGFDIYIHATEKEDLEAACLALEHLRGKGCKNTIAIESPHDAKELSCELVYGEEAFYPISFEEALKLPVEDFIATLTTDASYIIDMEDSLGTIEKGKLADMAIFDKNPMGMTAEEFFCYPAEMTVFNGKIINHQ